MATLLSLQQNISISSSILSKTPQLHQRNSSKQLPRTLFSSNQLPRNLFSSNQLPRTLPLNNNGRKSITRAAIDSRRSNSNSSNEPRETIMLPGCDYNHWLIVLEFPKDPAPTREQMIDTYLNTLATVLGSMEEAKKNMYAFSTTTYTGFQCTVSEDTSEKFKGMPGVLWVLPDSYIDVKNKDYGGDKYINGEIIPCTYPTYQPRPKSRGGDSRNDNSRRYVRRDNGPPKPTRHRQEANQSEAPTSG